MTYRELEVELRELRLWNYKQFIRNTNYSRRVGETYLAYLERKVKLRKQELALLNAINF